MRVSWLRAMFGLVSSLLVTMGAGLARAEDVPRFRLSWVRADGAESCPSERVLAERVARRLGRDPFDDRAEYGIEGSVRRDGERWSAQISVRDERSRLVGRRLLDATSADCASLFDAVTLAIALVIDPTAPDRSAAAADTTPAAGNDAPVCERPAPCPAPPACKPCAPPAPCPSCPPRDPARPPSVRVQAGARGVVAAGVLPQISAGFGASGEIGGESVSASAGVFWLAPAESDDGRFGFGLTAAALGASAALFDAGPVRLRLGAELQAGAVHVVSFQLAPLDVGNHLWLAAGLGPRAELRGPGFLVFSAGATAVLPVVRQSYRVRDEAQSPFETPPLGVLLFVEIAAGTR